MSSEHGRGPWVRRRAWICGSVWIAIGGPLFSASAHAQAWTLPEALARAERDAPSMVAARARLGLGDAAMQAARPALRDNPEVELGAGPRTAAGADPSLDLSLRIEQRIEIGGQRGARLDAARSVRALEDERLTGARFALRVAVRVAFYEALLAHERAASAGQIEAVQMRVTEIATGMLAAGETNRLGVRLSEADRAQAAQARVEADANDVMARLRLASLCGLPVEPPPTVTGRLPRPPPTPDTSKLIEQARSLQPARRVALAELQALERQANVASRESWVSPTIGLELAHEDGNQNIAMATFSVPLPLFDKNQGARAQSWAERDVARAELAASDKALPARITMLATAVRAAAERISIYERDVLPRFQENIKMLGRAFELGEIDALEVSAARARLVDAQNAALDSYTNYFDAILALQSETGVELPVETMP